MPQKRTPKKTTKKSRAELLKLVLPPLVGVVVLVSILGIFNSHLFAAKIGQGQAVLSATETDTANAILSESQPSEDTQATIAIAKIGVNAPVIYKQLPEDQAVFQEELKYGVVHYPNTALPGHRGNTVIFGHSSGVWWASGDYKFVFSQLDKLESGDKIFLDFDGKRFMYTVTSKKVVSPYDVSVLQPTSGHTLTLITCFPIGSDAERLVVLAEQTIPSPQADQVETTAQTAQQPTAPAALPGNSQSFWEALRSRF